MTIDQWRLIRAGDVVLDGNHRNARREIVEIKRVSGRRGQRGQVRVYVTCNNLKQPHRKTRIIISDEIAAARFQLPTAAS